MCARFRLLRVAWLGQGQRRLQRISEEWELAKQAQAVTSFEDAFRHGMEQKDGEYAGLAIAYLWRAVELSRSRQQSVQCRTALGAAYRARKDPLSLERAAAQYELILQHIPDHLPALPDLAAVLRDQGELEGGPADVRAGSGRRSARCPRAGRAGGCAARSGG